MKLRKVDPNIIKIPEVRVTAEFDEELYKQFKDSIAAIGQISPPICYEVDGQLVLCDGLHRLQEAINGGKTSIDIAVIPGDMVDVLTKNIFIDHLRGKTSVIQMVRVIKTLYQDYNLDSDKIRERTGLTRDYIEKLIKISEASPVVEEALTQGLIGIGHAYELSRLPHPIQQEELIVKHQVWRFTVKELHDQIDAVLREMDRMRNEAPVEPSSEDRKPREYSCEACKKPVEPRYLRPVLLCPNCFGDVWKLGKERDTAEVRKGEEEGGA